MAWLWQIVRWRCKRFRRIAGKVMAGVGLVRACGCCGDAFIWSSAVGDGCGLVC